MAVVGFLGKFPERLFYRVLRVRASTRGEGMGSFHRQFPRTVDGALEGAAGTRVEEPGVARHGRVGFLVEGCVRDTVVRGVRLPDGPFSQYRVAVEGGSGDQLFWWSVAMLVLQIEPIYAAVNIPR